MQHSPLTPRCVAEKHVAALLAHGGDPHARFARGRKALTLAAIGGHYETVRLLLARGAARDLRDAS